LNPRWRKVYQRAKTSSDRERFGFLYDTGNSAMQSHGDEDVQIYILISVIDDRYRFCVVAFAILV
jgi:hypothetical protein